MPDDCNFGTIVSGNRRRKQEFSSVQRAAMYANLAAGETYRAVAEQFNTQPSTAYF